MTSIQVSNLAGIADMGLTKEDPRFPSWRSVDLTIYWYHFKQHSVSLARMQLLDVVSTL